MSRLVPASLFGRTLLVLALGLLAAQSASLVLNLFDRGGSVYRLTAYQIASRIAQTARVLNSLPPEHRLAVAAHIDGRHLRVQLGARMQPASPGYEEHAPYEKAFAETLRQQIGAPWPLSVEIAAAPRPARPGGPPPASAGPFETWLARHFYFLLPGAFTLVAQVQLEDGAVAAFNATVPQESLSRYETLVPRLLLLVAVCFALAAFLVRMITRSLQRLAQAADALGEDPSGPPLDERGPTEIRRVVAAFNRMQGRVQRQLRERAQLLGAISHDLKTPITRMRLRSEMLAEPEARAKMLRDLDEMSAMVDSTLEFFRAIGKEARRQPVDIAALVESVCEDRRAAGDAVGWSGRPGAPFVAEPQALRRCLENLVGNAVRYGGSAHIEIDDDGRRLRIAVRDRGPGIPAEELERVFEPFYRVDSSRNRASGGTGLGLSIARNIARWHGGDIRLINAADGEGLVAELSLPR